MSWSSAALCQGREWVPVTNGDWKWVLCSLLRTRIETAKSPVETSRFFTTKKIQGHPYMCMKGYADFLLWPRRSPSDRFPEARDNNVCPALLTKFVHPSPSDQSKQPGKLTRDVILIHDNASLHCPQDYSTLAEVQVEGSQSPSIESNLSLRLRHFLSPQKKLLGANDSPRMTTANSKRGTGLHRSSRNFTRQTFTALCLSETSASTARANISKIHALFSVLRPPARYLLNVPNIFS